MTTPSTASVGRAPRAARRERNLTRWRRRSRIIGAFRLALPTAIALMSAAFVGWIAFGGLVGRIRGGQDVGTTGTIHMTNARFLGQDEQGRAYVLSAAGAARDNANPMRIALDRPAMTFDAAGANPTSISADTGVYHEDTRILMLSGQVKLHDIQGDDIATNQAIVDTVKGSVAGQTQVAGQGPTGAIHADSYAVTDRGQRLVFQGRVHSQLNSHGGQFALERAPERKR
jgi:lipopolysaccharide export system protein LptC